MQTQVAPYSGGDKVMPGQLDDVTTAVPQGHPFHANGGFSSQRDVIGSAYSEGPVSPHNLSQDTVTNYLHDNQEYLEKYVLAHIPPEKLERWLIRKTHQTQKRPRDADQGLNGDTSQPNTTSASLTKWKFCVHADKREMLQELTRNIHQHPNKAQVLSELTKCIESAVNADGANLYLVDETGLDIFYFKPNSDNTKSSSVCTRPIGPGSTLAAYVAHSKQTVRLKDIRRDERFPDGMGVGGETAQSVLAQPIIQASGEVIGVVELYRNKGNVAFGEEDEEVTAILHVLVDMTLKCHQMYHTMTKQRKLNDFLLTVTKSIFQDIVSMDTVIMKIMNFAQKLVSADRASLFLVDNHTKELYARIFDIGNTHDKRESSPEQQTEIRFPMDKGVAGHVASTGEILNIVDAYADNRFNRDVDQRTGYRTKTILCMPIKIRGNTIGVVQMVNKMNGNFNLADEQSFEMFAVYCGLALHHAKLYDKIRRSEQKYKVALEVLSYHSQAPDDEVEQMRHQDIPDAIPEITRYDFSPWDVTNDRKPLYVIYMFRDLFNMASSYLDEDDKRFDLSSLFKFTLTVRKNYRNVPYHNWAHAFSVAHAMYTIIKTTKNIFTPLECLALFVACLCHDVDHRGYTNQFMVKSASPLAAIYTTSTMEHHHFNQTITILQNEGHNIFKHLTSEEYKHVLGDIRHCILATDLALFFSNKGVLKDIINKEQFAWDDKGHRHLVQAIAMTACDLCASAKPWDVQMSTVKVIFEEFYAQGDEEKAQGNTPIPMMDRDKADQLPQSQVGFLVGICIPCYELLADLLPETKPMVDGANINLHKWKELADANKKAEEERNAAKEKNEAAKA